MLTLFLALQIAQTSPADTVLSAARRAVAPVTDSTSARANAFGPLFQRSILDRTPFQGEHWLSGPRLAKDTTLEIGLAEPAFVMFGFVAGRMQRVGTAYITRLPQGAAGPQGLGGDADAMWHTHQFCRDVPGQGALVLAESAEDCRARGGTTTPRQIHMVHVWTDVPNPEGIYGHDNPALPYLAVGLKPPEMHDLHDAARVRTIRGLAMALAETYDARMPASRAVETLNKDASLTDSVRARRAAIAAQLPALKAADASGKKQDYDRVADKMIGDWQALARLYERMAPTPELRALVKRENERAVTSSHH